MLGCRPPDLKLALDLESRDTSLSHHGSVHRTSTFLVGFAITKVKLGGGPVGSKHFGSDAARTVASVCNHLLNERIFQAGGNEGFVPNGRTSLVYGNPEALQGNDLAGNVSEYTTI